MRKAPKSFDDTDAEDKDELLRAAFAPENRILDPAYIEHGKDWKMFQWLRVRHRVDAEMMAEWCGDLRENLRPAAIRYLLHGELGSGVLQNLVPNEGRPRWLKEYSVVCQLLEDHGKEPWRYKSLLVALFPDRFHVQDQEEEEIGFIPSQRHSSNGYRNGGTTIRCAAKSLPTTRNALGRHGSGETASRRA